MRWCLGAYWGVLVVLSALGCSRSRPVERSSPPAAASSHAVIIHQPSKLASIETGRRDALGREQRVACSVCHGLRETASLPQATSELDEFHRGLKFEHGDLTCAACHLPTAPTSLKLADGRALPMVEVMTLCGQCHGPQMRDYRHGAHGGMNGHWDLRRGPRTRNNCVDCHDPHAPQIPIVTPVLKPKDRFLSAQGEEHHD